MERQSITFLKYISIIQRNTGRYFDLSLEADQIGSGQQGYVRIEVDEYDKRVRHLYITEQARGLIERVYDLRDSWNAQITEGFTPEEREQVLHLLERMAKGSCDSLSKLIESKEEEK